MAFFSYKIRPVGVLKARAWVKGASVLSVPFLLNACALLHAPSSSTPFLTPAQANERYLAFFSGDDKKQFNQALNGVADQLPFVWQGGENNKTTFSLTVSHTQLNAEGLLCRHYSLSLDRPYHRKQNFQSFACRNEEAQWIESHEDEI